MSTRGKGQHCFLEIFSRQFLSVPRTNIPVNTKAPHWYPVSPPKLAANRPVAFFAEPVKVAFGVALRHEFHAAVDDGVHCRLRQLVHLHEPLVNTARLNWFLAPV